MKNILTFLFCMQVMSAGAQKTIIQPVNLSGLTSRLTVVIQEVLDHAVLLHEDPAQAIVSYDVVVVSKKPAQEKTISVSGPTFSPEAIAYLQTMKGKKGTIEIRKIRTEKASVVFETPYRIELTFRE